MITLLMFHSSMYLMKAFFTRVQDCVITLSLQMSTYVLFLMYTLTLRLGVMILACLNLSTLLRGEWPWNSLDCLIDTLLTALSQLIGSKKPLVVWIILSTMYVSTVAWLINQV